MTIVRTIRALVGEIVDIQWSGPHGTLIERQTAPTDETFKARIASGLRPASRVSEAVGAARRPDLDQGWSVPPVRE